MSGQQSSKSICCQKNLEKFSIVSEAKSSHDLVEVFRVAVDCCLKSIFFKKIENQ